MLGEAVASLSEGFAMFDRDGRLVMSNAAFAEIFPDLEEPIVPGLAWPALLQAAARQRLFPDAEREPAWIEERQATALTEERKFEEERRDGAWFILRLNPIASGGFVVTGRDITERKRIDAAERSSEQMLRKLFESAAVSILMCRISDGAIIQRSPRSVELLGETSHAQQHYANPADRVEFLNQLLRERRIDDYQLACRRHDGGLFPGLVSARLTEWNGEQVIVATLLDMTDAFAHRDAMRQADTRLREAIDSLSEGFALFDSDERLVMANRAWIDANRPLASIIREGVSNEEIVRAAVETGHLVDGESWLEDFYREHATGSFSTLRRYEFETSDGTWYASARSPTHDGGFALTWVDITDQKRAREAERMADEVMRQVLDACPVTLVMSRISDGRVLYMSRHAVEEFGRFEDAGAYWHEPSKRREFLETIETEGRVDGMEFWADRKGAEPLRAAISARRTVFRGEPVVVSHAFDLTERIAMEDELARQKDILHQSEKLSALGELLAGVAHELNNPLSVVVGHSLMLQEETEDAALLRRVDKIGSAAERCAKIVKTFLAMARQRPTRMEPVVINDIVEEALDIVSFKLSASNIETDLRLVEGPVTVIGDSDQLIQVITNLILNAEQALQGSGSRRKITITTRCDSRADQVIVKIKDNGPGMSEAVRSRIFEPFFTTKKVGEGTGIGLAFCHRIISTHDGRIYVRSTEGQGAEFYIRLPAGETCGAAAPVEAEEPTSEQAGARALVIDDEADVAELIAEMLGAIGFKVTLAGTAEIAMMRLAEQDFALILSDLNMPGMGGQALLDEITERWPGLERKVAFVTGDTMSAMAGNFLAGSGRPYLEKPVAPAELRALAERITAANEEQERA